MDHIDTGIRIEDVVPRVDVADMVALGVVDAGLVGSDALERDLTHVSLPDCGHRRPLPAGL